MVGIPVVAHLRFKTSFQDVSKVWPFETGFTPRPTLSDRPFVLHAEIFPGLVPPREDRNIIKDQAQVRDLTAWLSDLDEAGDSRTVLRPTGRAHGRRSGCRHDRGGLDSRPHETPRDLNLCQRTFELSKLAQIGGGPGRAPGELASATSDPLIRYFGRRSTGRADPWPR